MADVYRRIDRVVGDLRAALGPETVFVIASDHGQSPTFVHRLYTQHRHGPDGVLLMHGPGIRRGHRLESSHVLDVFPTVLALLGLPVPEDAEGRVLEGAFESPPDPGSSTPGCDLSRRLAAGRYGGRHGRRTDAAGDRAPEGDGVPVA